MARLAEFFCLISLRDRELVGSFFSGDGELVASLFVGGLSPEECDKSWLAGWLDGDVV